jgi:hypothetical protein
MKFLANSVKYNLCRHVCLLNFDPLLSIGLTQFPDIYYNLSNGKFLAAAFQKSVKIREKYLPIERGELH